MQSLHLYIPCMLTVLREALDKTGVNLVDIDAVAFTNSAPWICHCDKCSFALHHKPEHRAVGTRGDHFCSMLHV